MQIYPNPADYRELARTRGCVPVWVEVTADGHTPVGAFARLRGLGRAPFLLESVEGGERWGRYSVVGVGHRARVVGELDGDELRVRVTAAPGLAAPEVTRPGLAAVAEVLERLACAPSPRLPPLLGGLVGVWGHDLVRVLESLPAPDRPAPELPVFELVATDTLVVFDNLRQRLRVMATACPSLDGGLDAARQAALERVEGLLAALDGPAPVPLLELTDAPPPPEMERPAPPWTHAAYLESVRRGQELVAEGEVFQVVLSQRFDVPRRTPAGEVTPLDLYRMLRVTNPAPYMYLLELPSATLTGASPEVLVRVERAAPDPKAPRRVTLRPIAGTRPRGATEAEDLELEAELRADPKERAEHLMLVDLGRNDVGRIARPGSVEVPASFQVERYSQVMHLVSEVQGILRDDLTALDALFAAFPAGTLSGAPKIRALRAIDELEPAGRGWYGGAVGVLGYDGAADFAIAIRSAVFQREVASVQAGAGIVRDSVPEAEDRECHHKARAVLRALAMARGAKRPEEAP